MIENISKFLVTLVRFALEATLKIEISGVFLPLKDTLLTTFNETRAPTSRKYVTERGIVMQN